MPPTIPIVSESSAVSSDETSLRPNAAPAALKRPSRMAAMPTVTSQPKNAEPQLMPPNSSRWRARTSRAVGGASSRAKRRCGSVAGAVPLRSVRPVSEALEHGPLRVPGTCPGKRL